MAAHDFGIMPAAPEPGRRYEAYEPEQYGCIRVDDELVEGILAHLSGMECYWHTPSALHRGLAYTGVTLIPPPSLKDFLEVVADAPCFGSLSALLRRALSEDKWVIHFGI